jgi:predicted NBD/HSP70 family sugar kinase
MLGKKIITFDIGKTKILFGVVKVGRSGFDFLELMERKNPHNPKKIEKIVGEYCQAAQNKFWTRKVAISAAHLVDPEEKIVRQGKTCYGADIFDFKFLERNGFSVRIENDGRCFALGEYFFRKRQFFGNILTLNLGTGIGGGFIKYGKNLKGAHNSAMEVSHVKVMSNGKLVDWAALCGGKGIENLYEKKTGRKIRAENIFLEDKNKNEDAKMVIRDAAEILGVGTANLVNILDPELIVFGGSLSKQKEFVNEAIKIAKKNVFNKHANYKFAISALGNKANLLGAAKNFINRA